MLQQTALKILKSGQNVFLTGSAGSGKTYLLNQYIAYLREHGIPVAVTASTGIAATHVGGQTIHSWSGLGIKDTVTDKDLEKLSKRKPLRERLQKAQVLVVDEISMLSGQNLEGVDRILKHFKGSNEAFGGLQVVFCGDFFQLPPVCKERRPSFERLAFMSPVWVEASLQICYLTEQFRAGDSDLLNVLNEIRSGDFTDSSQDLLYEKLESTAEHPPDKTVIRLYTHNADVDLVNYEQLQALPSSPEYFFATASGEKQLVETLKKSVLAPTELALKTGAQVMFVKNNYEAGYMNGTLGTVTGFTAEGWPVVTTLDDTEIVAQRVDWAVHNQFSQPVATYTQVPLRLAWAITVHKSQGMTLDAAAVDLSKTFEPGQGYVALSRVKSWSGLKLLGCNQNALLVDPLVLKADKRFQELADECEAAYGKLDAETLNTLFDQFVFRCGGTTDPREMAANKAKAASRVRTQGAGSSNSKKSRKPKVSTYEETKILVNAGKNLSEIAKIRELKESTIASHICRLIQEHPDMDFSKFRPSEETLRAVKECVQDLEADKNPDHFDARGHLKQSAIHQALGGQYGYEEIRLSQAFT